MKIKLKEITVREYKESYFKNKENDYALGFREKLDIRLF